MSRTRKTKATIEEVLVSTRHRGEFRDYVEEYFAFTEKEQTGSPFDFSRFEKAAAHQLSRGEREDALLEYSIRHWNTRLGCDDWTGEPALYTTQTWYEQLIRISYRAGGKTYQKTVTVSTDTANIDSVTVTYDKNNPDSIISVSAKTKNPFETYIYLSLGIIAAASLLVGLVLFTLLR